MTPVIRFSAVLIARPTNVPTARPSFPALRTEALCFVFFTFALRPWLALEAALVADLVNLRAVALALPLAPYLFGPVSFQPCCPFLQLSFSCDLLWIVIRLKADG